MSEKPNVDFHQIRPLPSPAEGFEEFCCQLARRVDGIPEGSMFQRYRGAGGDGGVECVWCLPSGEEWGWQAKYIPELNTRKLSESVETALRLHPKLARYTICLPFDLTGAKQGRAKTVVRGRWAQFTALTANWVELAAAGGMNVEFRLWDRSTLLDLLAAIDASGGRTRFWFGLEQLSEDWFGKQVAESAKAAEPRYTPKLTIEVPIARAFEALGQTARWKDSVSRLLKRIGEVTESWSEICEPGPNQMVGTPFPENTLEAGQRLTEYLSSLSEKVREWLASPRDPQALRGSERVAELAMRKAIECVSLLVEAFEEKHGEDKLDSVGWRQWMAEYEVSFPAHYVDTGRKVQTVLEEVFDYLRGDEGRLPSEPALLVTGPAGAGKTHSVCDAGLDRHKRGLRSIVLLGEHFADEEPWSQIRKLLGLPGDLSREEMLAALEAAGEASGYPCVIFVDGLNETRAQGMWHRHLVRVLEGIRSLEWVKLCVSCRTSYLDDVIAENVKIYQVEHTGFEGVEFDAFREFFSFYGIEAPSMPLLEPEFSNPLFLRLTCEVLYESGIERLPEGMLGISELVGAVLGAKNDSISRELDRDPKDRVVYRAVEALVGEIASGRQRWLGREAAKQIIEGIHSSGSWSQSLLNALIKHNILSEDRLIGPTGRPEDMVRFAFDRLADHLIVGRLLESVSDPVLAFQPGGSLEFLVTSRGSLLGHAGLLEALAVQLPERFGIELLTAVPEDSDQSLLVRAVIEGIGWRSSESMGPEVGEILLDTLAERSPLMVKSLNAMLSVGTRVANPLNADWMHGQLARLRMAERDEFWCPFLHFAFGQRGSVDRLIRWALEDDRDPPARDVTLLWVTQLAWFCAASDRRVRDAATMAMVRLLEDHAELCKNVIRQFVEVDDEYVVERVFAACYGALIRREDEKALRSAAVIVMELFEKDEIPKNALVRDYARLIAEMAHVHNALPPGKSIGVARPPYSSEWPLVWPSAEAVGGYKDSYKELPKLHYSCMEDDFAVYSVEHTLGRHDDLDSLAARRWIFMHVLEMGYPRDRSVEFDRYMLAKYGPGRSKPVWAERIGKKYQWISLYRLTARVADHLQRKTWSGEKEPRTSLQAPMERNLDPTVLVRRTLRTDGPAWWVTEQYDHESWSQEDNKAWLAGGDWPESRRLIEATEPTGGQDWFILWATYTWRKEMTSRPFGPSRTVVVYLRSYLVPREEAVRCWRWASRQDLANQREPDPLDLNGGFLGEYPWGSMCSEAIAETLQYYDGGKAKLGPFAIEFPAAWLNTHQEFDCYHESGFNLIVPGPVFFQGTGIRWNGVSGYQTLDAGEVLLDPSLVASGPSALLVRRDFLLSFLAAQDLGLVWTIVAEKIAVGSSMSAEGIVAYTRSHLLLDGQLRHSVGRVAPRGG